MRDSILYKFYFLIFALVLSFPSKGFCGGADGDGGSSVKTQEEELKSFLRKTPAYLALYLENKYKHLFVEKRYGDSGKIYIPERELSESCQESDVEKITQSFEEAEIRSGALGLIRGGRLSLDKVDYLRLLGVLFEKRLSPSCETHLEKIFDPKNNILASWVRPDFFANWDYHSFTSIRAQIEKGFFRDIGRKTEMSNPQVHFYFKDSGGCPSVNGESDASIYAQTVRPGWFKNDFASNIVTICFSMERISQYNKSSYREEVLGLFAHELVHFSSISSEKIAHRVGQKVLADFQFHFQKAKLMDLVERDAGFYAQVRESIQDRTSFKCINPEGQDFLGTGFATVQRGETELPFIFESRPDCFMALGSRTKSQICLPDYIFSANARLDKTRFFRRRILDLKIIEDYETLQACIEELEE